MFKDVLNLVFREKSAGEISTDRQATAAVDTGIKQREIISKCLQFLRFLARYLYTSHIFFSCSSLHMRLCVTQKEQNSSKASL